MSSQVSPKIYDIYEVGNQLAAYGKTRSLTTFERQQFELYFIQWNFLSGIYRRSFTVRR